MSRPSKQFDAIILGAGIAGLGVAHALTKKRKRVLVIEKKQLRGESTSAASGILDPFLGMDSSHPLLSLHVESLRKYPKHLREIAKHTDSDLGYHKTGMIYTAESSREVKQLKANLRWQKRTKIPVNWFDTSKLSRRMPEISPRVQAGILYPSVARVQPRKLKKAILDSLKNRSSRFIRTLDKPQVLSNKDGVQGVKLGGQQFETGCVVNAMGSWAGKDSVAGYKWPLKPIRGQILVMKGKLPLDRVVHSLEGTYIVPWGANQYVLGSTVESVGYNAEVSLKGLEDICRRSIRLIPDLRKLKLSSAWAGLRPYGKDGLPLIGSAGKPGFYIAGGYYRSGILIGFYAGELLARGILSGKMPIELKRFDPKRFKGK